MKKEIITGMTLLGAMTMAENKDEVKEPLYRVVPRTSSVIIKGKKVYVTNDKSMCTADVKSTKESEGKYLKDIKCSPSKNDPNYNYWKKVAASKNIRIYDTDTQKDIIKKIKDTETKYEDASSKHNNVVGSDIVHFDLVAIPPKEDKPKEDSIKNKPVDTKNKEGKNNTKRKIVYVNQEDLKGNKKKEKKETKINDFLKNYSKELSNKF